MPPDSASEPTLDKQWTFLDLTAQSQPLETEESAAPPAEQQVISTPPAALSDAAVSSALDAERAKAREREAFVHQLQSNLAASKQEVARLTNEFEALQLQHYRLNHSHDDLIASLRQAHATVEHYTTQRKGLLSKLFRRG